MSFLKRASMIAALCGLLSASATIGDEGPRKRGPRDSGKPAAEGNREQSARQSRAERKTQRIFKAYDRNADGKVVFAEWVAMKEGAMNAARTAREKKWFDTADADGNGSLTVEEFHAWLNRKPAREGEQKGPVDNPGRRKGNGDKPGRKAAEGREG